MAESITKPQIKKIYISAKNMGMNDDDLHGLVYNMTGSEHISTIMKAQASRVIDYLADRLKNNYRAEAASRQQLYKIRQLAAEYGWGDNPKRLAGFIKRTAGVESERWLTAGGAYKVIEGLKKMISRQKGGKGKNDSARVEKG